ncbi:MAG: hypothetical protein ACRBK7_28770 [Acidimicrobiales bacterium]
MALRSWLSKLVVPGSGGVPGRTTGPPTSSNGASSFHLSWEVPPTPLLEVGATFEVLEPPVAPELYFWALQVSFMQGPARRGGAHFGLQYHPNYPNGGAVNWGGYQDVGGEIDGSVSALPSALDNINTRTYAWQPGRQYRHRIYRSPDRGWRGSITDLETGVETVVRDLWIDADSMLSPMVWSEVFADCDHPSVAIRWSELDATAVDGSTFRTNSVRLNYQTFGDGGCANSNTSTDHLGFVQRTATERTNPTGARLTLNG